MSSDGWMRNSLESSSDSSTDFIFTYVFLLGDMTPITWPFLFERSVFPAVRLSLFERFGIHSGLQNGSVTLFTAKNPCGRVKWIVPL